MREIPKSRKIRDEIFEPSLLRQLSKQTKHHAISDEEELVIFFYVPSIMDGSFYISPDIVLLTIVVLIICYLLSKIWQAQLEPNFKIKGKRSVFSKKSKIQL